MTTTGPPPTIDYTSRDFAGFRESMLAYAADVMPDWKSARTGDPNDFGVVLIEALAYEGDILSYYTDRLANEAFLQTATQRQSVLNHAALLDYTPRGATAAVVEVAITVSTTTEVTIPEGFQLTTSGSTTAGTTAAGAPDMQSDSGPLTFETTAPLTFSASPNPQTLTVLAVQGETVFDEVVATLCADPNDSHQLGRSPVISDSVVIRVVESPNSQGTVWQRVTNLLDAGPNDNAYTLSVDADGVATVTMGDGVNGRIAPRGAVMHASYRIGGGADGNVDVGDVVDIVDPDDIDFGDGASTPIEITVTNLRPGFGGSDGESIESIRQNAPRNRRTGDRAVSLEDYENIARSVPDVEVQHAKAVAAVYTNVTLYVAPPGGVQPDQRTLNAVVQYLQPRKMAGVTVVAASPTFVPVNVSMTILVDQRFDQSSVKLAVSNALAKLFEFENVGFGEDVTLSRVYNAAIGVQGVINVQVTGLYREGGTVVGGDSPTSTADVVLSDNELALAGVITLTAQGGMVNTGSAAGAGLTPTASAAPTVLLLRCDPASTHIELQWTPGADATHWEVEAQFRKPDNSVVRTTVAGPFSVPHAVFDMPRIGVNYGASQIAFRTRSFNGNIGPVFSDFTTTPYLCE